MKKYLMIGFAAIAFASCSNHDFETMTQEQIIKAEYDAKFIATFGQPSRSQTWGFGASTRAFTRSGNTSGSYTPWPATHEYTDASGKVIAGANMNCNEWADPDKYFGGWIVPDALTPGQKLRVQKFFQAVTELSYEDPGYANFFVQQVYTGGTSAPTTGNKESTVAADGTVHAGAKLNQLTVGTACSHINNFNEGTCTERDVLDNNQHVGGTTHKDQITLMVNVDDTSCFGYHETGGSNVKGVINHNDKMALVSAAVIDAWAAANGNPGEAVVDKWNRSFMGFDYELLPEEDIIPENPTYAKFTDVPAYNNIQYAWDGTNVMVIGEKPATVPAGTQVDVTKYFAQCYNGSVTNDENGIVYTSNGWSGLQAYTFGDGNSDWSKFAKFVIEFKEATPEDTQIQLGGDQNKFDIAKGTTTFEVDLTNVTGQGGTATLYAPTAGTYNISKIYLVTGEQEDNTLYYDPNGYLLGESNKIMFYSSENTNQYGGTIINLSEDEMKTTQDDKTCLNLVKFKELYDGGYHPISTDLKKWVKWEAACDGYYSDWIVTLTKAERITPPDDYTPQYQGRIMAEDLTANNDPTGKKSDWDFNDVVFDWDIHDGKAYIKLLAAGGTLPLTIGGELNAEGTEVVGGVEVHGKFGVSTNTMVNTGLAEREAKEFVLNDGITYTNGDANAIKLYVKKGGQWIEITAEQGEPAGKFNCEVGTEWCDEYVDIRRVYPQFAAWVGNEKVNWATLETGRAVLTDENLENNDVYPLIEE
jgi:hypothetical protein